jgi:hypothetical protein
MEYLACQSATLHAAAGTKQPAAFPLRGRLSISSEVRP